LRDPHVRKLGVWLPPQYDEGGKRRFPVLYDLVGFTARASPTPTGRPFGDNVRSARRGSSASRRWGRRSSSCRIASPRSRQPVRELRAIGDYADYSRAKIVPFVDGEFRTLASREHRGCFGKSSGGYGAVLHGMKYAKTWGAIAITPGRVFRFRLLARLAEHAERARQAPPARAKAGAYDALRESKRKGLAEGKDDGRSGGSFRTCGRRKNFPSRKSTAS